MTTLVFTVIGDDRAGLVDTLASPIVAHHGSWQRSHLARLAGKFAGIVVVDVPNDEADALVADIEAITSQGLLHARVAVAGADNETRGSRELHVQLVSQDRPGIVHEIARALAARGVSIDELETRTESASMSGEHLFHACVPPADDGARGCTRLIRLQRNAVEFTKITAYSGWMTEEQAKNLLEKGGE